MALVGSATCNFVQGTSQARFKRDGAVIDDSLLHVNSTTVTDPNHCTANITIAPYCDPGPADVTVSNFGDEVMPLDAGFQIISHNPRISTVSPSAGLRGQDHVMVDIVGIDTAFVHGQSAAAFGQGITVNSTSVIDPTHATADISISGSATFGPRNVNVTTGGEVPDPLNAGFTVEQFDPVVTSITPNQGPDTGVINITNLAGGNFQPGVTVKLVKASQADIVATNVVRVSSTRITCRFDLTGKFGGPWDVEVTNPDGKSGTLNNGFTVQWAAPTIASIDPNEAATNTTVVIDNLAGANFKEGATVRLTKAGEPDIQSLAQPELVSPSQLACSFELKKFNPITGLWDPAKRGRWNVVVTNMDGQVATLTNGFTMPFDNAPSVTGVNPGSGEAGGLVQVTIAGTYFEDLAVPKLKSAAYGDITGTVVSINPAKTELTASFDLSGAHWGYRGVEVMNDDGQLDSITNAYRVTQTVAPTITSISPSNGYVGNNVTVNGTGFGLTRADSVVKFNGKAATSYSSWSDTRIVCKVPSGASSGDLVVTACGLTSNGKAFTVNSTEPPPPQEPAKTTWYLAEGTTDYGFGTYINIQNPNPTAVTAKVTYMTKAGPRSRAALTLAPMSQTVINPLEDIGATDFSTKIECEEEDKTICVDRRMVWTGANAPASEGHSSVGVTAPAKRWYLAEGSSKWGFETWLLIQNPGTSDAHVNVTYMIEGKAPVVKAKVVKAGARASYSMETDIGQADASIMVESTDQPVIPERAMYRYNRREGHDSIGTTTPAKDFYLAEGTTDWGFTTYVLVQNPNNQAANVTITYMTPTGAVAQPAFQMEPNSRKTINVNSVVAKKDLSIKVSGSLPIIAERAMYWGAGSAMGEACHDSIGMAAPHMTFYMPDGETYNGTETWTLVQNPNNSAVNIEITYLGTGGQGNKTLTDSIPANSRKSYNMADKMPASRAAVLVKSKSAGKKIMVERAMYWGANRAAGTDTIGGYSD